MSVHVSGAIWRTHVGNRAHKYVLLAIADNSDDYGLAFPGIETIARKSEMSSRQVMRTIKDLEAAGWLTVSPNPRSKREHQYQINLDKVDFSRPVAPVRKAAKTPDKMSPIPNEKQVTSTAGIGDIGGSKQVTFTAGIGDIGGLHNKRNRQQPSEEPSHTPESDAPAPTLVKTYPIPDLDEISRQIVCAHPWALARHITPIRVAWTMQTAVIEAVMAEAEAGNADPAAVAKLMLAKMQHLAMNVPPDRWRWFANPDRFFRNGDYHLPPSRFVEAPQPVQETMSYADRDHQAERQRIRELRDQRARRGTGS